MPVTESIQEATKIYGDKAICEETITSSKEVLLGDASTPVAKVRASEVILGSAYAALTNKPTKGVYIPSGDVGYCIENSRYYIDPTGESKDEYALRVDPTDLYLDYFDDPRERIENIFSRSYEKSLKKGFSKERAHAIANEKAAIYLSTLPATQFITGLDDRYVTSNVNEANKVGQFLTKQFKKAFYIDGESKFVLEMPNEVNSKGIMLEDLKTAEPQILTSFAAKICCPECSYGALASGGDRAEHILGMNGKLYKNYGSFQSRQGEVKCSQFRKFDTTNIPLSDLIELGFRMSGAATYVGESITSIKSGLIIGIRDYSNPRGTVEMVSKLWEGNLVVTPRIYVMVNKDGEKRDATLHELVEFIEEQGTRVIEDYISVLTKVSDGRTYSLNLTEKTIEIFS